MTIPVHRMLHHVPCVCVCFALFFLDLRSQAVGSTTSWCFPLSGEPIFRRPVLHSCAAISLVRRVID
jgi:hypothetical protein